MGILSKIRQLLSTGQTLEQAVDAVVPGADVTFWQAALNRPEDARPKRRATRRASSRRQRRATLPTSATTQAAERGRATVELVDRANGREPEAGNSWGGGRAVLVNLPGECRVIEVGR